MSAPVAHETRIATDLARKAAIASPAIVAVALVVRGVDGAISAAIALVIVSANFLASAALIARAARLGPNLIAAAVLGGFLVRLGAILAIVLVLSDRPWIDAPALVVVLAATHLVLLFWEMRSVSLTVAYPGLHPKSGSR